MGFPIKLDDMSIEEKIQTMETIWDDLCKTADNVLSPPWHKTILSEREEKLKTGDDNFLDWEEARKQIRDKIS